MSAEWWLGTAAIVAFIGIGVWYWWLTRPLDELRRELREIERGETVSDEQTAPDTPVRGHHVDEEELRVFEVVEADDPEKPFQTHHVVARYPSEAIEQVEHDLSPDYRHGLDHTPLHVRMLKPETEVEVGYLHPDDTPDAEGLEIIRDNDQEGFDFYAKGTAEAWVKHFAHVGVLSTTAGF